MSQVAQAGIQQSKPVVVVTSDEPWSDVWHTQIHYAHHLSKSNNVIFMGPPEKWSLRTLIKPSAPKVVSNSLVLMTYWNPIPSVFKSLSVWFNDLLNQFRSDQVCKSMSWDNRSLVWHFDRYRSVDIWRRRGQVRHIYHVIDPVADLNYDRYLSGTSDLVIVVSRRYLAHYQLINENVLFQGQGFDASFLSVPPSDLSRYHAGSILLLGTMLDDVDYELLIALATRFAERKLVLIGPDRVTKPDRRILFEQLLSMTNVVWTGSLPPDKHMPYIWSSAVCIIAYETSGKVFQKPRVFGTPLKVMTYLGCRKPVVTNIDCEIPELDQIAIFEEKRSEAFMDRVDSCLRNPDVGYSDRIDCYLENNSYPTIIGKILDKLSNHQQDKV